MTDLPKIVRWVSYDEAAELPGVLHGFIDTAEERHLEALVAHIRGHGLKFSGETYQEKCVPVFDDGATYLATQRTWGGVMAEIWNRGTYVDWAWGLPTGVTEVLP